MPRIGVARALHTYHHFPLWRTFFEELGFEVVLGRRTDKEIVARGVELAPAELCLPVKVFLGQIEDLYARVDFIFLPRLVCRRLQGDLYFGCPKALGLPDLVRALFPETDRFLELVIDHQLGKDEDGFVSCAARLEIRNSSARRAFQRACKEEKRASEILKNGALPVDLFEQKPLARQLVRNQEKPHIGVIGHPYLVCDEHISLNLLKILDELGVVPVVPFVTEEELLSEAGRENALNWFYELEVIAGARKLLQKKEIKGLLLVFSFACGTAPVVNEIIRREVEGNSRLPTLSLFFDEHSGEVGLRTRLESFVDLVQAGARRK
jgi:predicted nucleotide-binding protein (sugar kinase/HSP70/actin superfamily)